MPLMLGIGAGLIALDVIICLFIVANPEAAAAVFAGRSDVFTLMLYRSVLAFSWTDCERDLAADTPFPVLVKNCRRRAVGRLVVFFAGFVVLALLFVTGHPPRFTSRL